MATAVVNTKEVNKSLMDVQKYILKDEKDLVDGIKHGYSCLDGIPARYTDYAYELILAATLRELEANFKNE